jgi:cytochrome c biogenesis protein CcdA
VIALALLALSVGAADSLNPSTIAPALYLATGAQPERRVIQFTLGVFAVYCAGGIAIVLGPGEAILAAVPHPGARETHLLELALGGLALGAAAVLWLARDRIRRRLGRPAGRPGRSSFALGAAIMAVELPTAFPYFAVIAALLGSSLDLGRRLVLIVVFNLAFIVPLAAIAAARRLAGARADPSLAAWRARVERHGATLVIAATALLAVALLVVGAVGLLTA